MMRVGTRPRCFYIPVTPHGGSGKAAIRLQGEGTYATQIGAILTEYHEISEASHRLRESRRAHSDVQYLVGESGIAGRCR